MNLELLNLRSVRTGLRDLKDEIKNAEVLYAGDHLILFRYPMKKGFEGLIEEIYDNIIAASHYSRRLPQKIQCSLGLFLVSNRAGDWTNRYFAPAMNNTLFSSAFTVQNNSSFARLKSAIASCPNLPVSPEDREDDRRNSDEFLIAVVSMNIWVTFVV